MTNEQKPKTFHAWAERTREPTSLERLTIIKFSEIQVMEIDRQLRLFPDDQYLKGRKEAYEEVLGFINRSTEPTR